jgi:hypothetical protein
MNNLTLEKEVKRICSELISEKGFIAPIDVLLRLQYLSKVDYEKWRNGGIDYLERVCKVNLGKLSKINIIMRKHARIMNLTPSWTAYNKYGKGNKVRLRFSKSGNINIEKNYATHYISSHQMSKHKNESKS